jgi:hypothetical protein
MMSGKETREMGREARAAARSFAKYRWRQFSKIPATNRRGMSVIVVLGLIAISMAASYALLRAESAIVRTQQNANRQDLARQAAMVGLAVAIHNMEQSSWGGVGTTLSGSLNSTDSYSVTYTAGDSSLTTSSTSYWEYPYRVTLLSTGTSVDQTNSQSKGTHKVQAVVRLIPRNFASDPTGWSTLLTYTLFQLSNQTVNLDAPCQVAGPVFLQGAVQLSDDYAWSSNACRQYASDLNLMRSHGYSDYRWLTGPVWYPQNSTSSQDRNVLSQLGVSTTNVSVGSSMGSFSIQNIFSTYRLYPGGPAYNVGSVPNGATSLVADPVQNPLGIFYSSSSVTLGNNATVNGTLICGGDITVTGSGVTFTPVNLMPLYGTSTPIYLPAIVTGNRVHFTSTGQASITGVVIAGSQFLIDVGPQADAVSVVGNVLTGAFTINMRNEWNAMGLLWTAVFSTFNAQKNHGIPYFPVYLSTIGLNYVPALTVTPNPTTVTNHCPDLSSGPVYLVGSSDSGLRWELVGWTDLH